MASIDFYVGENFTASNTSTSGVGFYGANFGYSIPVASYQDTTFVTDSTGTTENVQIDNTKYHSTSGVLVNGATIPIHVKQLPNYLCTVNVRFTHSSAVQVQNGRMYFGSRSSKTGNPGVTVKAYDCIHPPTAQTMVGSGTGTWTTCSGTSYLTLHAGPGSSGFSPNGTGTTDSRHDWFVPISCSPQTVGAAEFAAWAELEYL